MTDLCRWSGWGGASASLWRSPHAAPQSVGLGEDRRGRCGPGPSTEVTSTRPPLLDPSLLPAPPVWETAAPHCPRRQEELLGTSRACRHPDLEGKKEEEKEGEGSEVSGYIKQGLQRSRCITWSERDGYKGKERFGTVIEAGGAGKKRLLVSFLMLLVKRKWMCNIV